MLFRASIIFILGLILSACATTPSKSSGSKSGEVDVHSQVPKDVTSFRADDPVPPELKVEEFDAIPHEINPAVEKWVNYFTGRGREHMERYLSRSTRYEKLMKKILRENGMPEDLIYIALIESGFSSKATSHASAVGYWQFIRGTGRRYGLEINSFVDERRDPVLATQAAADYFKGLYSEFNSWYLAMASYNVGEGRVRREVRKNKTNDFWVLAKKRRLPRETLNYVPKFLAARMIAKNPEHYGFIDLAYEPPIEYDTLGITEPLNLKLMAEKMDVDYAEMKRMNPKYRGEVVPIGKSGRVDLRVPIGMMSQAVASAQAAKVDQVIFVADKGETDVYRVRKGDTLGKIARKFRTSIAYLKDINNLSKRGTIRAGRTIFVPVVDDRHYANVKPKKATSDGLTYVAQPGDTLVEIAEKYDMSLNELKDLNEIESGYVLKTGVRLKIKKIDDSDNASPSEVAASPDLPVEAKPTPELNQAPPLEGAALVVENEKKEETQSPTYHKVVSGENLTLIAKKYGTTVGAIKKANKIGRRSVIKAGLVLIIPEAESSEKQEKPATVNSSRKQQKNIVHIVRKGDTLSEISERYGVGIAKIRAKNRLAKQENLNYGTKIVIPIEGAKR